jgi:hypothetical protein
MNWRAAKTLVFKGQKFPWEQRKGQERAELSYKAIFSCFLQMPGILAKRIRKQSSFLTWLPGFLSHRRCARRWEVVKLFVLH